MNLLSLDKKQITPYCQGQYDSKGNLVGGEILMRFRSANIADAITQLEATKLIYQLDLYAIATGVKWYLKNNLPCSVNMSGFTFGTDGIVEKICELTRSININFLKIELTEGNNLTDLAIDNFKELNALGFKLSCDDYGKEYNGLNRLLSLPFSQIKIDRLLVSNINYFEPNKAVSLVKHTILLAEELNIEIIAEGVETHEQLTILNGLGCNYFQGFLFGRPHKIAV